MGGPLIDRAWRRPALVAGVAGLVVFLTLAVVTFHGKRTTFDSWAFRVLPEHISGTVGQFLLGFTEPAVSVLLLAITAVLAASVRRFDLVTLAVVGPAVGTALASDVAKPIIHRTLFGASVGSFPSGHETGVACTATVLVVAVGQLPVRRAAKYALAAVLTIWVIVAAVGLTRFYYHYATDTIGALGWSVAFVLGLAALLDRGWPGRGRSRDRHEPRDRHAPRDRHEQRDRHDARVRRSGPRPARRPGPGPARRPLPPADLVRAEDQLTPRV